MSHKRMTLDPDPWNAWIYDQSHPDYGSPRAEHLRASRAQAIASAPRWMIAEARDNHYRAGADDDRAST